MEIEEQINLSCKIHPIHNISFLKISEDNFELLKCEECILQECIFQKCQIQDFISLKTIKTCDQSHVFMNWPPINDMNILKDFQKFQQPNCQIITEIELFFDNLIQEVVSKLEKEKKQMILQIISINEQKEEFFKIYNLISGKDKLKSLCNFKTQNIYNELDVLNKFISEFMKKKDQNSKILNEQLKRIQLEQIYELEDLQQLGQSILKQIDEFIESISLKKKSRQSLIQQQLGQLDSLFGTYGLSEFSITSEVIENINENKISILKKNNCIQPEQIYFEYNLTNEKTYIFRFRFNDKAGDYIILGLINQNNVNSSLDYTFKGKKFGKKDKEYGGKVVKGNLFGQIKKDQIIEMRVDIQNKKLEFLDYPDYENINEIHDKYQLNKNCTYYLAIFLCGKFQTCIDLLYFSETQK
ncbi:hypothetical protein ABPG72_000767 [Tetrahymena utriculariae]